MGYHISRGNPMNLIETIKLFPDQESCIEFLEKFLWGDNPRCSRCGSRKVSKRNEKVIGRIGRWSCYVCNSSFKVVKGTVFHGTKIPLQKWFLAIALMENTEKRLSSGHLARALDLNQKTAWYMQTRIRAEMTEKKNPLFKGIIEVMSPRSI